MQHISLTPYKLLNSSVYSLLFCVTTYRSYKLSRLVRFVMAYNNLYCRCSVVSLNLCKEYLNRATFKISLSIKSWTFWYIERLHTSSYTGVTYFQKWSTFLGPPCKCWAL